MRYLRKYIENFWFVNRVVWLTVKYNLYLIFLSNRQLMHYILNLKKGNFYPEIEQTHVQSLLIFDRRIDRVINLIPLKKNCLIKSLVKKSFFELINVNLRIAFGLKKENNIILPHAWVETIHKDFKYKRVHI